MRRKMEMEKCLSLLFYGVTVLCGLQSQGQEVLFSTLDGAKKPVPLDINLSSITNTRELIIMDDFKLLKKSRITGFTFIGQLGKSTPENIKLIKGVRLYIFRGFKTSQPLSDETSLNYFELIREYSSGLKITQQGEQVNISIDIKSLGFSMMLDAGTYGIAFAPIIAVDDIPSDKVWYWYQGTETGKGIAIWEGNSWLLSGSRSVAFSIEGKQLVLDTPESTYAVEVKVYPNPSANGIFTITSPKEIATVLVYDLSGKRVVQDSSEVIDLSAFPKGVYWAAVTCNDGTCFYKKLIKI